MEKKNITLVEVSSEIGAGTRGASTGPQAIKAVAFNEQSIFFKKYKPIKVRVDNDVLFDETDTPNALRIHDYAKVFEQTSNTVSESMSLSNIFIFLTGDHSNAASILQGIRRAKPHKKLGIIWIDAHADLHSPYTSPSGNIHGMPLAIVLGIDNLENKRNQPNEITKKLWEQFKNVSAGSPQPKLAFIGLRDTEQEEDFLVKKHEIPVFRVEDLEQKDFNEEIEELTQYFEDCDEIYISFDVDSMDPQEVSDGTGTPVRSGLELDQSINLVEQLIRELPKVKYFELTEVNPLLDSKGNRMAEAAHQILKTAIESFEVKANS